MDVVVGLGTYSIPPLIYCKVRVLQDSENSEINLLLTHLHSKIPAQEIKPFILHSERQHPPHKSVQ